MNFFYSEFFSCDLCKIIDGNLCKIVDRKMAIFGVEKIDGNFFKINGVFGDEKIYGNFS